MPPQAKPRHYEPLKEALSGDPSVVAQEVPDGDVGTLAAEEAPRPSPGAGDEPAPASTSVAAVLARRCCGSDRTTKYCPECGKLLQDGLYALVRDLESRIARAQAKREKAEVGGEPDAATTAAQNLARFTAWRDELVEMLDGREAAAAKP